MVHWSVILFDCEVHLCCVELFVLAVVLPELCTQDYLFVFPDDIQLCVCVFQHLANSSICVYVSVHLECLDLYSCVFRRCFKQIAQVYPVNNCLQYFVGFSIKYCVVLSVLRTDDLLFDHFEATNSKRSTLLFLQEKYDMYLCYDTIARNLRNPLYKGMYRDDPDFCERTISPERFDRIQRLAVRNVRRRVKTNRTYIFTGLLICSSCNHYLVSAATIRTLADGSEKEYRFYRCNQRYQSHNCDRARSYREQDIEDYLLDHVRPALSQYLAKFEVSAGNVQRKDPAADASKIRRKLEKLYELFMDDLIDKESYREKYDDLQAQLKKCQAIVPAPRRDLSEMKELLAQNWEEVYQTFTAAEKNTFWKSFIESILVYEDGSMDISFL